MSLARLSILLGTVPVGELSLHEDDVTEFTFLDSYRRMAHRPVLGQAFEDDLSAVHRSRMALPPFFSNLLPEGALRELLAQRFAVSPSREFHLLARLGDDLPGAVRAVAEMPVTEVGPTHEEAPAVPEERPLKFSLAGVQLKLSMLREGRGLTLPVSGRGGDWIVKLPDPRHRGVPENEFVTMTWARHAGITIPEVELVSVGELSGLPAEMISDPKDKALAVRRFDRPAPGTRVHMEDFAQILGKYSAEKYGSTNYETVGRIIMQTAGVPAFDEFVRRLVFTIISGNGDAHIKNWSLLYPDGVRAELSPAYDLVSTIEFIHPDALALNLGRNKRWDKFTLEHFEIFARRVGVEANQVTRLVAETIQRSRAGWESVRREHQVSPTLAERLEEHWKQMPLVHPSAIG